MVVVRCGGGEKVQVRNSRVGSEAVRPGRLSLQNQNPLEARAGRMILVQCEAQRPTGNRDDRRTRPMSSAEARGCASECRQ